MPSERGGCCSADNCPQAQRAAEAAELQRLRSDNEQLEGRCLGLDALAQQHAERAARLQVRQRERK